MTRNPYTPPAASVRDAAEVSDTPAYEPGSFGFFFSIKGRLNRKQFWANGILSIVLLPVLFGIVGALVHVPWIVVLSMIAGAWSTIVLVARRAHDFGCSAWWAALYAVSLFIVAPGLTEYGVAAQWAFLTPLLVLLVFGLIPGDRATNKFGVTQHDGPPSPAEGGPGLIHENDPVLGNYTYSSGSESWWSRRIKSDGERFVIRGKGRRPSESQLMIWRNLESNLEHIIAVAISAVSPPPMRADLFKTEDLKLREIRIELDGAVLVFLDCPAVEAATPVGPMVTFRDGILSTSRWVP